MTFFVTRHLYTARQAPDGCHRRLRPARAERTCALTGPPFRRSAQRDAEHSCTRCEEFPSRTSVPRVPCHLCLVGNHSLYFLRAQGDDIGDNVLENFRRRKACLGVRIDVASMFCFSEAGTIRANA